MTSQCATSTGEYTTCLLPRKKNQTTQLHNWQYLQIRQKQANRQ